MNKRFTILNITFSLLLIVFAFSGLEVLADGDPGQFENPLTVDSLMELLRIVLNNIILPIGVIVVALAIIWSGYLFVSAGGNEQQISKARTTFTWTMVGAAILLGAWAITQAIESTICQIAPDTPGC